jgi:L-alanine-DL-glutamate epimerase-like enolase superfamily enzyme
MRISSLNLYHFSQPFRVGFMSPQFHRTAADSIIVVLGFDNGLVGFGESAPRGYVTGETCASVSRVIAGNFAPVLMGRRVAHLEDVHDCLADLERTCALNGLGPVNSAIGAIDLALLDGLGRQLGVPAQSFLQAARPGTMPLSISVPLLPLEMVERLWGLIDGKITLQALKVLLENDRSANRRRVACIRAMIPPEMELRLEANGKWSAREALENLDALRGYLPAAVEEPLIPADRGMLRELRRRFGIPVVLDESIQTADDLARFAGDEAVDVVNIKVSKCGGLLKSQALAQEARRRGIRVQVGAHVGESEILGAAGRILAGAIPDLTVYEGCSHLLFANLMQSASCNPPEPSPDRPGLGVAHASTEALLAQAACLSRSTG